MFQQRLLNSLLAAFALGGLLLASVPVSAEPASGRSWTADNGNGTFTNPLFYDEFSDPDLIRVGEDFYLAGTTMHAMPALVVLHSKDLVNWRFLSYATDRLDLGPAFRLEGGDVYGQGIWAPCIRYHDGVFYLFSNVNGYGLQVFTSRDAAGPWAHRKIDTGIHDLSVLFDDDGKVYAIYGYDEVHLIEFNKALDGFVAGSDRVIIPRGNAMGEGHHFYKIGGKYYIISADYAPVGRMQCARADRIDGPYETAVISARETLGTQKGWANRNLWLDRRIPEPGDTFELVGPGGNQFGAVPLHQGGIVDLPNGEWWGFSMLDFRSVGRTTSLSPVNWKDGWPYFGLPGNLGRSPRTWFKPAVAAPSAPAAPYERSDEFDGPRLLPVWQWNHLPVAAKWSLSENPGALRLHSLPADQFLRAKNTLTQRVIGPVSVATTELDFAGLKPGDHAGLAVLNMPFASLGVVRTETGGVLRFYDQRRNLQIDRVLGGSRVTLRISGDYDADAARFSYAEGGGGFTEIGEEVLLPYQLKTFQGSRYSLFNYNTDGREGGYADFAYFRVEEPLADRRANLPLGKVVTLRNHADGSVLWAGPRGLLHSAGANSKEAQGREVQFLVHDRGQGRVALEAAGGRGFLTVVGLGLSADVRLRPQESAGSLFLWQDMLRGQCMLLSLKTQRFIGKHLETGEPYSAIAEGSEPDRKNGTVLDWTVVE